MTESELSDITVQVNKMHVYKFDDTQDFAGCVYVDDVDEACNKIATFFNYKKAKNHKSS